MDGNLTFKRADTKLTNLTAARARWTCLHHVFPCSSVCSVFQSGWSVWLLCKPRFAFPCHLVWLIEKMLKIFTLLCITLRSECSKSVLTFACEFSFFKSGFFWPPFFSLSLFWGAPSIFDSFSSAVTYLLSWKYIFHICKVYFCNFIGFPRWVR